MANAVFAERRLPRLRELPHIHPLASLCDWFRVRLRRPAGRRNRFDLSRSAAGKAMTGVVSAAAYVVADSIAPRPYLSWRRGQYGSTRIARQTLLWQLAHRAAHDVRR